MIRNYSLVLLAACSAFLVAFYLLPGLSSSGNGLARAADDMTPSPAKAVGGEPFALVELFTSQGCSSCPPADRVLRELSSDAKSKNLNIYPLSFHVDYWNYLGWKDPYSGETATERQRRYARTLGSGVYTPQLVVNGSSELPGHHRGKVRNLVDSALRSPVSVALKTNISEKSSDYVRIEYVVDKAPPGSILRFAVVETPQPNEVSRGENAGRTLSHTNVVRQLHSFELKNVKNGSVEVNTPFTKASENREIVSFVQHKDSMRVFVASRLPLP